MGGFGEHVEQTVHNISRTVQIATAAQVVMAAALTSVAAATMGECMDAAASFVSGKGRQVDRLDTAVIADHRALGGEGYIIADVVSYPEEGARTMRNARIDRVHVRGYDGVSARIPVVGGEQPVATDYVVAQPPRWSSVRGLIAFFATLVSTERNSR
jgi:hypothetical protein